MLQIFRALAERIKSMFIADAALDLEAEFLSRDAERKAELLRQATRYEEEGLHGIAGHLRQQADALSIQRPLAGVLPAIAHLQAGSNGTADELSSPANGSLTNLEAPRSPRVLSGPKKKGGKR